MATHATFLCGFHEEMDPAVVDVDEINVQAEAILKLDTVVRLGPFFPLRGSP